VSPTQAKSSGSGINYKFAILEPSIQIKGIQKRTFAFRFKEVSSNNWIAVGICHKNIIVQKGYNFTYSQLNHGAYMISSNGGSWSNISSTYNNVVKAFKFGKGDLVTCEYDPFNLQLIFRKEKTKEEYKLEIKHISDDQLHPCCLFYYLNDEIEFINNYVGGKEEKKN